MTFENVILLFSYRKNRLFTYKNTNSCSFLLKKGRFARRTAGTTPKRYSEPPAAFLFFAVRIAGLPQFRHTAAPP